MSNQRIHYNQFVDELRNYLEVTGGIPPRIDGHRALQWALETLCSRIRANQRGGHKRAERRRQGMVQG